MKVCIIGNGLVSLALANVLIQKDLSVDILSVGKGKKYNKMRTLGISKSNIEYLSKYISNLDKILWEIKNIKVYNENFAKKEILSFTNKDKQIFSITKNQKLYEVLNKNLIKSKIVKFKSNLDYKTIIKKRYKLIINCDYTHEISKKFFSNRFEKNYNSYAYTTIIRHKKVIKNNTAIQIFTNNGPIAFLPISNLQTSVVFSLRVKNDKKKFDIKNLIKRFNPKYKIISINDCSKLELKSSNLRNYYKDNILAFGDLLHKIHPLAGQGFNMSIRDIKDLSKLIDKKINVGLDIDGSICSEFQKNSKDKNYIFSMGIDWVYELFNFESKINSQIISKSISFISKNKSINSFFKKFADIGLKI